MKSFLTVGLVSLSCILVNQVSAEPFNDRGPDWIAMASPGHAAIASSASRQTLTVAGFNDRDQDWLAAVVPGQGPGECEPGGYFASAYGFNDKSFAPAPSYLSPSAGSGAIAGNSRTHQDHLC